MKEYRVSKYNIYLSLKNNDFLLVQGIRGSFDVVDSSIAMCLQNNDQVTTTKETFGFSDDIFQALLRRGYITDMSEVEEYELLQKISIAINEQKRKTLSITVLPTYNCNFRCEYCFERNLQNKGKKWLDARMSTTTVDSIFNQLKKYVEAGKHVDGIYLFGGEPLLRSNKDIVEYICSKSREMNLPIYCISNGYDLDSYIDLLVEYKFKYIQITIDGIEAEHDKRRYLAGGQGSFARIMKNVALALENGVNIVLRTNVNKKNINEMQRLVELYSSKGWIGMPNFKYYFKSTLRCYDAACDAYSDIELIKDLSKELGVSNHEVFQFNSIYGSLSDSLVYMIKNNGFAPLRSGYCGANVGMYTIDPFGDIYPCWDVLSEESERIGYVNNETDEFVFNENHDRWKCRTVDKIPDCKECPYLLFCGGGCAAQAKVMHNDINKVFCDGFQKVFDQVATEVCEKIIQENEKG